MKDEVWRATVDPTGRWAKVTVIRDATDHDGKIEWPGGPSSYSLTGCEVDILHQLPPQTGDAVSTWLELATGRLVDDPTVIGTIGGELLHRAADGALVLGAPPSPRATRRSKVCSTRGDGASRGRRSVAPDVTRGRRAARKLEDSRELALACLLL